ncbi:MAG: cysteine--tRNA ligase [Peptoniphilus sp.]|uniref:cysteine--tRNA ligase n=1 Tax=Peptoniphilus sp. TaxID=1971214 RepID=UPI0025FFEDB1|nr:cysteine--tRNA ligase [Peptoniphilus sp.]MCI5643811.1 cysteine--tRNA ligase [Peptoniphilus sp.]MDD7353283.1 cysteine--tRNA ligase [Peptoniphilaceae bacterium]MDY3902884.1 cysteine--tRNA ligase [Peptoniphilus sp.]
MKLYNTLTRKKEDFVPIKEGEVGIYNCGPTVYNFIHVGNARPLVVFDTLRRYFEYKGLKVKFVVNFTDIDDKIINRANDEGVTVTDISERFIKEFKKDANGLHLYDYETLNPRATEHINEIIAFIKTLIDKKAAYVSNGDVYFDISYAKDYGKLSKKNIEDLISGHRVDINDNKRNPMDFALWKNKKEGEPFWKAPWGEGRPGWHIECSVMAKDLIGDNIDIHTGGEDLQFPHHENEIAQSETCNGVPFANYWLHNGMITVDNEKMSKSKGNFFTVREVAKEFDLEVLRFFLLTTQYRSPINFSREVMEQTKNSSKRLYNAKYKLEDAIEKSSVEKISAEEEKLYKSFDKHVEKFENAMDDDLNTADAITAIFDLVKDINLNLDENNSKEMLEKTLELLKKLTRVLGIMEGEREEISEDIEKLIEERNEARKNKDFAKSDEIRDKLKKMGVEIEDTRSGTTWKRI